MSASPFKNVLARLMERTTCLAKQETKIAIPVHAPTVVGHARRTPVLPSVLQSETHITQPLMGWNMTWRKLSRWDTSKLCYPFISFSLHREGPWSCDLAIVILKEIAYLSCGFPTGMWTSIAELEGKGNEGCNLSIHGIHTPQSRPSPNAFWQCNFSINSHVALWWKGASSD